MYSLEEVIKACWRCLEQRWVGQGAAVNHQGTAGYTRGEGGGTKVHQMVTIHVMQQLGLVCGRVGSLLKSVTSGWRQGTAVSHSGDRGVVWWGTKVSKWFTLHVNNNLGWSAATWGHFKKRSLLGGRKIGGLA